MSNSSTSGSTHYPDRQFRVWGCWLPSCLEVFSRSIVLAEGTLQVATHEDSQHMDILNNISTHTHKNVRLLDPNLNLLLWFCDEQKRDYAGCYVCDKCTCLRCNVKWHHHSHETGPVKPGGESDFVCNLPKLLGNLMDHGGKLQHINWCLYWAVVFKCYDLSGR